MKLLHLVIVASLVALGFLLIELAPTPVGRNRTAAAPAKDDARGFVVKDVRVFDGDRLWTRASVQVAGGRIEAMAESLPIPAGYATIDGTGRTLLPGLIDAHVHTWGDARRDALRFGVTTLLDMFSDHRQLAAARRARQSLEPVREADLWSAGTLATAAGGHGTQFGMDIPTLARADEASAWVAARKAEGSDWIKLVREDLHTYSKTQRLPTLDDATAAAVIEAAHAQGLRAVVHASALEAARASLRDGADGLVHVFQDVVADDAFVALGRARGAFVIPTLTVAAGMSGENSSLAQDPRIAPLLSASQKQTLGGSFGFGDADRALLENARASVRRLHAAGVVILAGTDAPNPNTAHGASLHEELAHLVAAGLTPLEALSAATARSADAFGLADRGRIAVGQRADLLLVEGDPASDITTTRAIVTIWKNGHAVDRALDTAVAAPAWHAGALSHFDGDSLDAAIGSGWSPTTDQMADGQSLVDLSHIAGGADASAGAMRIEGEIIAAAPWPWAGAIYSPGNAMMQPVDASALRELVFQARGDGRDYAVMMFSGAQMGTPAMRPFSAGAQWQEVRIPLAQFAGLDATQLRAFAITAGLPAGKFRLEIDAVEVR